MQGVQGVEMGGEGRGGRGAAQPTGDHLKAQRHAPRPQRGHQPLQPHLRRALVAAAEARVVGVQQQRRAWAGWGAVGEKGGGGEAHRECLAPAEGRACPQRVRPCRETGGVQGLGFNLNLQPKNLKPDSVP
jgi:hypothetical protein